MNKPTKEQIEGMVMYSLYLDDTVYDEVLKVEVFIDEDCIRLTADCGEGDWMFASVTIPLNYSMREFDKAVDELVAKLYPIIQARTNQQS